MLYKNSDSRKLSLEYLKKIFHKVFIKGNYVVLPHYTKQQKKKVKPGKDHIKETFLVDFQDSIFNPIYLSIERDFGKNPTPSQLKTFTNKYILSNYERSFDIASRVAQIKEGDCTEHTLFLSALSRKYRYPTKIAMGFVIYLFGGQLKATVHMWPEVFSSDLWQIQDSAFSVENSSFSVYVPLFYLEDESYFYQFNFLVSTLNTIPNLVELKK